MKNKQSSLFLSSIAASSILLAPALHAAAITWDAGGADKNWSTINNWSDNATATGDDVTFNATGALTAGNTTNTVDASISINSLTYGFESNTLQHTTAIAAGQTLAVTGNFHLTPSATATTSTNVTITGATGALTVNGTLFQIGQTASTVIGSTQSLDMSGLGTLTANLGASGIFRLSGTPITTAGSNGIVVKLASTSTITADVIGVGDAGGRTAPNTLKLGSTANTFNANTINIGSAGYNGRTHGELSFETGTGTLKLRAADGVSAVTEMNLINSSYGTANAQIATADFAGHDVDANITTLTMGRRSATGTNSANATFTFDTGTLEVGTLNLGEYANAGANAGTINAIMNIGGGNATFGAINMATSNSSAGTTINSTLNFTGGTTTVNGAITKGGGGNGTTTANLNLNGAAAILDMTSGNLTNLTTITYTNGLLKNLSVVNTGMTLAGTGSRVFEQATGISGEIQGSITGSGVGLSKSGTGTLILSGNNTYTGATTVSEGTLLVDGSLAAGSSVTVASGATLGGSGTINGAAVVNGTLQPGNSPGVLTFNSSLTLGANSTVVMELNGTARGTGYDGIDVNGALTYDGALTINVDTTLSSNQTFSLFAGSGSKSGNFDSVSLTGAYTGSFSNTLGVWNLADSSGNQWSFSQATGNLGFTAVPEPSTYALLAIAGLGLFFAARRRKVQA